jgi:hypothetical protein
MGLTITVNDFDSFDIGYMGFGNFRIDLAEAYNEKLGDYYKRWVFSSIPYMDVEKLSNKEFNEMLEIAGDLMIFLAHKDTEGSFTPSESRKIYKCIENLKMDYEINPTYHGQGSFNVLERLKSMFYYSWKNRRRLIFL